MKYRVTMRETTVIEAFTDVEADNEEDAEAIAENRFDQFNDDSVWQQSDYYGEHNIELVEEHEEQDETEG